MKVSKRILVIAIIAMLALASACGTKENQDNQGSNGFGSSKSDTVQVQILATSDTHGKFMPYDYATGSDSYAGSMAQVADAVKSIRTENTIIVDAGDIIQGNSADIFFDEEIHPMIAAMNEIGYDAWVTGNHEYNYGMDVLKTIIAQNNAKLILGNVRDSAGQLLGEPYVIIEKSGIKIALIGMVTSNITFWDAEHLKGYTVTNAVEETRKIIDEIKDQVDILVAVQHMMIDNELGNDNTGVTDLANACPELDLIIAAHGHNAIDNMTINGVPIVENKNEANTLAQAVFNLEKTNDGWKILSVDTALLDMSGYEADSDLKAVLEPYHQKALDDLETIIGHFDGKYLAAPNEILDIPTAQIEDTALLDYINEVMLYYSGAKVSATPLLQIDANLVQETEKTLLQASDSEINNLAGNLIQGFKLEMNNLNLYNGNITNKDIAHIYKYANSLYKLEMTGAQLKTWMEWSAAYFNSFNDGDLTISFNPNMPLYNYDCFAGVNYEINISKEPGSRIENLCWPDGTPVKDDDVFEVAATNYRASSMLTQYGTIFKEGDSLPVITEVEVAGNIGSIRELIKDYIKNVQGGELKASCDNNWKITGYSWDPELRAKAVELINNGTIVVPWSASGRTPNTVSVTVDQIKEY